MTQPIEVSVEEIHPRHAKGGGRLLHPVLYRGVEVMDLHLLPIPIQGIPKDLLDARILCGKRAQKITKF